MIKKMKIIFFTGNRAEFGLMAPIIKKAKDTIGIEYKVIVSGNHLNEEYGMTKSEIEKEGFNLDYTIQLNLKDTSKIGRANQTSKIINEVSKILDAEKPDYLFVLGDRYETFAAATAGFISGVPIAHEGGGTVTEGGCLDDSLRHSITKLSSLHFVTCEENLKNIKKLGEEQWRICLSGSTAIDTILEEKLFEIGELEEELKLDFSKPIILFTQHPVKGEKIQTIHEISESLIALKNSGYQTIVTYPNSDLGSEYIINEFKKYENEENFRFYKSLGRKRYLSVMKYSAVVVGNSSSGLLETPIFGIPTVNIGDRQLGRIQCENVINVSYDNKKIRNAINKCLCDKEFISKARNCNNPFGNGKASNKIIDFLEKNLNNKHLKAKKLV